MIAQRIKTDEKLANKFQSYNNQEWRDKSPGLKVLGALWAKKKLRRRRRRR